MRDKVVTNYTEKDWIKLIDRKLSILLRTVEYFDDPHTLEQSEYEDSKEPIYNEILDIKKNLEGLAESLGYYKVHVNVWEDIAAQWEEIENE